MAKAKIPGQQISIRGFRHGGARDGAGRPNLTGEPAHLKRPQLGGKICATVQFELNDDRPSLRKKVFEKSFKRALALSNEKGWRILRYSLRTTQVNLLVECDHNSMLESCTKSFGTSLSKRLNLITGKTGPVFKGRYRIEVMQNPAQLRKVVQTAYEPKNTLTEAPQYYVSYTASEALQEQAGVKNLLRGPSIAWIKQTLSGNA